MLLTTFSHLMLSWHPSNPTVILLQELFEKIDWTMVVSLDSKELKEQGRGAYYCMSDKENKILAVKWFDNSTVWIATNFEPLEPVQSVRRFSRKEKQHVQISQPHLIKSYNQRMGGVDLHDNFVAKYRVRVKAKKWWWPLFVDMLDSAVVNACHIHRFLKKLTISSLSVGKLQSNC